VDRPRDTRGAGSIRAWALALLWAASGCGPSRETAAPEVPGITTRELDSPNGLAFNGLAFNGLAFNGLAFNGLSVTGLSSPAFAAWFQADPALASMVMGYVVQCALPAGQVRTYTAEGQTYIWSGNLGLAPDWTEGAPATVAEQQLISACLALHANKYGMHVPLSVLGRTALGQDIPVAPTELTDFARREGCFFGNLFNGEGVYAGGDGPPLKDNESSPRACALIHANTSSDAQPCEPIVRISQHCHKACKHDASKTFYTECTYNGVTYLPLTTRLSKNPLYTCGDGVCQVTESCGQGSGGKRYDDCGKDCGVCD
jgi:hypothetical protein